MTAGIHTCRAFLLLALLAVGLPIASAHAQDINKCNVDLFKSSYQNLSDFKYDWRLTVYVDQDIWNNAKSTFGATALLYGIPIGLNFSSYHDAGERKVSSEQQSLTKDDALNIVWSGLDPAGATAYADCLSHTSMPQMWLSIAGANKSSVILRLHNSVLSGVTFELKWLPNSFGVLPSTENMNLVQEDFIIPRPTQDTQVSVNVLEPYHTSSNVITITPWIEPAAIDVSPDCAKRDDTGFRYCKVCDVYLKGKTASAGSSMIASCFGFRPGTRYSIDGTVHLRCRYQPGVYMRILASDKVAGHTLSAHDSIDNGGVADYDISGDTTFDVPPSGEVRFTISEDGKHCQIDAIDVPDSMSQVVFRAF